MQQKRNKRKIRTKKESIAIVSPLVTPAEAAVVLRCDPRTIISMVQSGQLRGEKVGGRYKVSRSSLDKFVRQIEGDHFSLSTASSSATNVAAPSLAAAGGK